MKNNLKVIKTIRGEVVLAELFLAEEDGKWKFVNPFIIDFTGEMSAIQFLPGASQNIFEIEKSYVVTYALPDDYITKFYGSVLFRYASNILLSRDSEGNTSEKEQENIKDRIDNLRSSINANFGMLEAGGEETTSPASSHLYIHGASGTVH